MAPPTDQGPKDIADKAAQILKLLEQLGLQANSLASIEPKEHKFWSTQPVPQSQEELLSVKEEGPIQQEKPAIKPDPLKLPDEFEWFELDLSDPRSREDLYVLLNENYVEDLSSMFRFDYPANFLEWALKSPGWKESWHVGVRVKANQKLVAFISAIPTKFRVREKTIESVEVNFLCVHKKLRSKRMAPVLIKEITRRVNLEGIFQALYTAGTLLPEPISIAQYYHRPLNYQKLCDTRFTTVPIAKTMSQMLERYRLPTSSPLSMRTMVQTDVPHALKLFQKYSAKFAMTPLFNEEECAHWLLPRDGIIFSFVIPSNDPENTIDGFISFYSLPTAVLEASESQRTINSAYLFYYAVRDEADLEKLVQACLIEARRKGFDVFNCVEIMDNINFLENLKFAPGDGSLHYYLYNWKASLMTPSDVAVVML